MKVLQRLERIQSILKSISELDDISFHLLTDAIYEVREERRRPFGPKKTAKAATTEKMETPTERKSSDRRYRRKLGYHFVRGGWRVTKSGKKYYVGPHYSGKGKVGNNNAVPKDGPFQKAFFAYLKRSQDSMTQIHQREFANALSYNQFFSMCTGRTAMPEAVKSKILRIMAKNRP